MTGDGRVEIDILTRPAVFPIATIFGLVSGIIISPVVFISLRNKNFLIAGRVIVMLVAVLTAGINIAAGPIALGLSGSFILPLIMLLVWRQFGLEAQSTTKSNNSLERDV